MTRVGILALLAAAVVACGDKSACMDACNKTQQEAAKACGPAPDGQDEASAKAHAECTKKSLDASYQCIAACDAK